MDLQEVWRIREEEVYPALFGPVKRGIFTLSFDLFHWRFGPVTLDPLWLSMGVFEFAPHGDRKHWLYVTSGYSNPYYVEPEDYDADGVSGAGAEFTFAVSEQGDWAIEALQSVLALELLLGTESLPHRDKLGFHDRIPLHGPINGDPACQIRNLVVVQREDGPQEFQLPSGKVALVGLTGFTDGEMAFAQSNSSDALLTRLRDAGCHPVTNPQRASIL